MWTVVNGDDSDQWILPGIHTVNRICYLVTEVPHDWKDIALKSSYLICRTMRSNTHCFASFATSSRLCTDSNRAETTNE